MKTGNKVNRNKKQCFLLFKTNNNKDLKNKSRYLKLLLIAVTERSY